MTDKNDKSRILNDIVTLKGPSSAPEKRSLVSGFEPSSSASSSSSRPSSSVYLDGRSPSAQPSSSASSHTSSDDKKAGAGIMKGMPFPDPVLVPTQEGAHGLRFDFNIGIRAILPPGKWTIRFRDLDTYTVLYQTEGDALQVLSRKRHFINARIELEKDGEIVWAHDYDAAGKDVAVVMPGGTLGDSLGWFPYAVRFAKKHQCRLTVMLSEPLKKLLEPVYPDIRFVLADEFDAIRETLYATYYLGLFFDDEENSWQPADFRYVGLHRTAGYILGVDPTEEPPRVDIEDEDTRPIEEPYVVVAVQASCGCKMWNNPTGWMDTVQHLKAKGYRVICIDRDPAVASSIHWNVIPNGVEDETGNRPLKERARWLKHADFFVGLSSGLSWLAWSVGTPVVLISGFTHPSNEFHTPYRVFSTHGCNSCWHDVRTPFKHNDYMFCPRHKGTPRFFECTRIISADYVNATIDRVCQDYAVPKLGKKRKNKKRARSKKA
ncbi:MULTISPECIES: autotransporter strand-loop-strand O-heptosyltransferase [unclassified Saccharibacter]|uniref:autotransporter strand-loop-strand O-heptosyltransferase n=1 Tax=unclassified Saccharibacter TaxID=2648722 RepID=UPI0013256B78|nr:MULTISPECIES: autotransporter strand-loop-strand O-heptosyltransferase [unclassified Saccharibacter]MXV36513.1 autotransporter strand-loop-strand O-heptosyltransferase [Saccharibacter sp. EH611]MXV57675.1 autotransporter strand-loop-strand O-heptosyltransferase [Saccharibacter sp. EH70]MXV65018.1 autotransporter strand-loop-strand O-heptosyltransferase [Saccharibacter sp. EH60]